mgnify:CR=1 FL=1
MRLIFGRWQKSPDFQQPSAVLAYRDRGKAYALAKADLPDEMHSDEEEAAVDGPLPEQEPPDGGAHAHRPKDRD